MHLIKPSLLSYPLAVAIIYSNAIFTGVYTVIFTINAEYLAHRWGLAETADVYIAIGALGIGKCVGMVLAGLFSDHYGRKTTSLAVMSLFIIFLLAMYVITDLYTALAFALIAGIANSFVDCASYPALQECAPAAAAPAIVGIKIFISFGIMISPVLLSYILKHHLEQRLVFLIFACYLTCCSAVLLAARFPQANRITDRKGHITTKDQMFKETPRFSIEGICLVVLGFTTFGTFYLAQQSFKSLGLALHMSSTESAYLLSIYSIGTVSASIALTLLLKRLITPTCALIVSPIGSIAALLFLYFVHTPVAAQFCAFAIGLFAASGAYQLTIVVMLEFFPNRRGLYSSFVAVAAALAMVAMPPIIGQFLRTDIFNLLLVDSVVASIALICALIVRYRYLRVMQ